MKYKELKQALVKDINKYTDEYVANLYNSGKRVAPLWNGFCSFIECDLIDDDSVLEIAVSTSIRIDIRKYLKDRFGIKKKFFEWDKGKYYNKGYVNYYQKASFVGLTTRDLEDIAKHLKEINKQ